MKIVTFNCQTSVFVFQDGCGLAPQQPFTQHKSIEEAKTHLKAEGIESLEIIEYKKREHNQPQGLNKEQ